MRHGHMAYTCPFRKIHQSSDLELARLRNRDCRESILVLASTTSIFQSTSSSGAFGVIRKSDLEMELYKLRHHLGHYPCLCSYGCLPASFAHDNILSLVLSFSGNPMSYSTSIQYSFLLEMVPVHFCLLLSTLIYTNCVKYHAYSDDLKMYIPSFDSICRHINTSLKSSLDTNSASIKQKQNSQSPPTHEVVIGQSIVFSFHSTSICSNQTAPSFFSLS